MRRRHRWPVAPAGVRVHRDTSDRLANAVEATWNAAENLIVILDSKIENERRLQAEKRQAIDAAARRRQAQARALLSTAADRACLDVDAWLARSSDYSRHDWHSEVWTGTHPLATDVPHLVKIATIRLASTHGVVELPFAVPPLGTNLVITHDPGGQATAYALAQGYLVRALASSIPGSLRVHLLDPGGSGRQLGVLARLPEPLGTGGVRTTRSEVSAELHDALDHIDRLDSQLLTGGSDSLTSRWHTGTADGAACSIVLAAGFGTGYTADDARTLLAIAARGHRCGASVVAVLDAGDPLPHGTSLDELTARAEHIHVGADGGAHWRSAPSDAYRAGRLRVPDPPGEEQHRFLAERAAPAAHERHAQPITVGGPLSDGQRLTRSALVAVPRQRRSSHPDPRHGGTISLPGVPAAPSYLQQPAVAAYRATLSRLASSLHGTDVLVNSIHQETEERQEQHIRARASRFHGLEAARSEAEAEAGRAAGLRAVGGGPPNTVQHGRVYAGGFEHPPAKAEPALSLLRRRRRELDRAEADYWRWRRTYDEFSKMLVVIVSGLVGLITTVLITTLSSAPALSPMTLGLLGLSTLAVVASGGGVAYLRGLPDLLALEPEVPDPAGPVAVTPVASAGRGALAVRFAVRLGVPAAVCLAVARLAIEVLR